MDSDQDITQELDRLNAQLAALAAAEDIKLAANDADGQHSLPEQQQLGGAQVLRQQTNHSQVQHEAGASAQRHQQASHSQQTKLPTTHNHTSTEKASMLPAQQPQPMHPSAAIASGANTQAAISASTQTPDIPSQPDTSSQQQQMILSPDNQQQTQHDSLLQQLLHQHGKLLDLLQLMATNSNGRTRNSRHRQPHHVQLQHKLSCSSDIVSDSSYSIAAENPNYLASQQQSQDQLMDNRLLRKRLNKVQKVLLQHLQEAKLKAAAADAACHEAHRREQEAVAAAAALQVQVADQQEHLQRQQHELYSLKDQLLQVKELHKQKLAQAKADMKQHYEAQLQATTAVYAQELAQIQSHMSVGRQKPHSSKQSRADTTATAAALEAIHRIEQHKKTQRPGTAPQATAGSVRHPGPAVASAFSNNTFADVAAALSSCTATTAGDPFFAADAADCRVCPFVTEKSQRSGSGDLHVPAEVVQYAERYQQGGEGACRPPTAPPSVLQRKRQQEQPVPEAAAQLAQHFVAGGEGVSRPLTAPSSDRCGLMPCSSSSPAPRSSRPCTRSDAVMPAAT